MQFVNTTRGQSSSFYYIRNLCEINVCRLVGVLCYQSILFILPIIACIVTRGKLESQLSGRESLITETEITQCDRYLLNHCSGVQFQ